MNPIVVKVGLKASKEKVWRAITEVNQMREWYFDSYKNALNDVNYWKAYAQALVTVTEDTYIDSLLDWQGLAQQVQLLQQVYPAYQWEGKRVLKHNQEILRTNLFPVKSLNIFLEDINLYEIKDQKIVSKKTTGFYHLEKFDGKVILTLKNGTSPIGYYYNADVLCIVEWQNEKAYQAFTEKHPLSFYKTLQNVHQFVIQ